MIDTPKLVVVWRDKGTTLSSPVVFENEAAARAWAIKNVKSYSWKVLQLYTYRRVVFDIWECVVHFSVFLVICKIIYTILGIE